VERKLSLPRSLFQWLVAAVVAAILLGFVLGTKMLFVAGAIILLGFAVGVVQSAIALRQNRPRLGVLGLLPHGAALLLVGVLLYIVVREFLRAT